MLFHFFLRRHRGLLADPLFQKGPFFSQFLKARPPEEIER
jgi:hypothetical protein